MVYYSCKALRRKIMYIKMHLYKESFDKIKNGTKTVEMRILDDKRRYLTDGDTILFIRKENEEDTFEATVVGVHIYPTFKELYQNFSKTELGYNENDVADYRDMEKYYPIEEQLENCVVGIEVKVK